MKLIHVGLDLHGLDARELSALEGVFNSAESWLRYGAGCWVLWTDESEKEWCHRIENAIASENKRSLVCKLNSEGGSGWLSQSAWSWLRDKEYQLAQYEQQALPMDDERRVRRH